MKKLIAILILALSVQGAAQAQFGGLLNKAKTKTKEVATKEAKKSVEKKAEQTLDTEQTKVSEALSQNVPSGGANAQDIDSFLGVSMSALNASYDKLDPDIYFTLRKDMPGMFYTQSGLETDKAQSPLRQVILYMMASGKECPCIVYQPESGMYALPADLIINANFAVFKAFPKETYPLFVEARMMLRAMEEGKISLDYEDPNTILSLADGDKIKFNLSEYRKYGYGYKDVLIMYPSGTQKKSNVRWKEEEERLMELYRKYVPFENVKNTFFNTMIGTVKAGEEKNWARGVYQSYKLAIAAEDMQSHPKKVEDQDYTDALAAYEKMKVNNFPKWEAVVKKDWMELYARIKKNSGGKAEIPKAATSNPKLEAEMIAIAKGIYDDGRVPVKAIIQGADWSYTRNALGGIIDRYHTAFIIFKMEDGTYRMVDIGFKQLYNGGSYGKTQLRGIGLVNEEVDYK